MDPISLVITSALTNVAKAGIKEAYDGLKSVIRQKWGDDSAISKAISAMEESPNSKGRAAVVEEEADAVKAADHPEVAQALQKLVEQMKANGAGGEAVAGIHLNISGGTQQGIIGASNVSANTLNFGKT
jgi:hypothetical protein